MGAVITALGAALPDKTLDNAELAARLDVTEDWIVARTGIRTRRVVSENDTAASLATTAARRVLEQGEIDPQQIDMVIVATCSADYQLPATAPLVASAIGAKNAGAFDLNAACSGFLFSLAQATALVENGTSRRVLVCGADVLSRYADPTDVGSSILFGDGAGAALVEHIDGESRLGPFSMRADGSYAELLWIPRETGMLKMHGREVYRHAVEAMTTSVQELIKEANLTADDIDLLVAHQANARILQAVADRLGFESERVVTNIARVGNTSAASIPLAIAEAHESGLIKDGDRIMLTAFGAGFSWGAGLLVWGTGTSAEPKLAVDGESRG
jgi:3-oxoacyl-[acyl-carrier-protein] synthase III